MFGKQNTTDTIRVYKKGLFTRVKKGTYTVSYDPIIGVIFKKGLGGLRSLDLAVRSRSHYPDCATSPTRIEYNDTKNLTEYMTRYLKSSPKGFDPST
jgi:hypothetical protein